MTQITRYVYDEQGTDTVLGLPATAIVDTWDGEIDTGGIRIDDAYYLDDILITGNNSAELLQLLALVLNIKRLHRTSKITVTGLNGNISPITANITINGTVVKDAYILVNEDVTINTDATEDKFILVELTLAQTTACQNLIPNIAGISASLFNIFVLAAKTDLKLCTIIMLYNSIITASRLVNGYTILQYITGPGSSLIVTDLYANERSKLEATLLFSQNNVLYPRLITTGRYDQNSYSSSFESTVTGTLHVSYGNVSSWTVYDNIQGDYSRHTYIFDKNKFYIDGTLIGSGPTTAFNSNTPFAVFGETNNRSGSQEPKGCIYHMAFWQDDVLVADMYPAKDSNGICGMYDILRDRFFTPTNGAYTEP